MSKQPKIDDFIKNLESVIDIRYNINKEIELCNHRDLLRIKETEYDTAMKKLENSIEALLTLDMK